MINCDVEIVIVNCRAQLQVVFYHGENNKGQSLLSDSSICDILKNPKIQES